MNDKPYFMYVIRCENNSLYAGITTDVERRFQEHTEGRTLAAKYTRAHKPLSVEAVWQCRNKGSALSLEYAFKQLSKEIKEDIIKAPDKLKTIREDIDFEVYKKSTE